jgi:GT2 family glycosyltransferase
VAEGSDLTVVVVTWQGAHLLPECLASLAGQTLPHDLIVVDNASSDGTAQLLANDFPRASVLTLARNTGFAGGVAAALGEVRTPHVALLNNDAAVAVLRADADVAAVTAKLLLWDSDRINNAGVVLTRDGYGADRGLDQPDGAPYDSAAEVFGFSGGAAVLRTDAVRAAGGVPARFFLYYEDTDLAWRLRLAGWHVRYRPDAVVRHRHAATSNRDSPMFAYYNERNRLLMLLRCAPADFAVRQLLRFCITSASLAIRRAMRERVPNVPVFRLRLRLRVLAGVARWLPWALRERRAIGRRATVPRQVVADEWVGR